MSSKFLVVFGLNQVTLKSLKFSAEVTLPVRNNIPLRYILLQVAYWKISKLYINVGSAFEKQPPLEKGTSAVYWHRIGQNVKNTHSYEKKDILQAHTYKKL